ncbi:hypothetical protein F5884DRAFT_789588 [Xylogone sp. PMI_703]|nr:hypothetical protein F5884DRAFT_789588 [Xylogone sp. PMI_703]
MWTPHKKMWKMFHIPLGPRFFTAKVDGYLEHRDTGVIRAILEAKPALRESDPAVYRMQECAEFIGWICSDDTLAEECAIGSSLPRIRTKFSSVLL